MVTDEGRTADNPQERQNLELAGFTPCYNRTFCDFMIAPEIAEQAADAGGSFTCPNCGMSYNLLARVGNYPGAKGGGGTIAGVKMGDQGQIAEDLVENMKVIPGYGPITWWHPGGSTMNSPLDGAVAEWGVEVKAINADAKNLRFIPGRDHEKAAKAAQAVSMGLKGVLGLLVLLNYRTSLADVYAMEMPNDPWVTKTGYQVRGPIAFRHHNAVHLVAELPFNNPLMNPHDPSPEVAQPTAGATLTDDIPF